MQRVNWLDGISLAVGVWLMAALWFVEAPGAAGDLQVARWTFGLVGLGVVYLSLGILFAFSAWEEWATATLGLWLIVSPWLLGYATLTAAVWNAVLAGAVLVAIGVRRGTGSGRDGGA